MPWKASSVVDERMKFMARLKDGERMSDLCREFGISRELGYRLKRRFETLGTLALVDASSRPKTSPGRTPDELVKRILALRDQHPSWGPKKIREWIRERVPDVRVPAGSTVGEILQRHGKVAPRRRRERWPTLEGHSLSTPKSANELWCADFKGQFRLANGRYCYPLTITDRFSRFVIACDGFDRIDGGLTKEAFALAFARYGLPKSIRTDNGPPFASRGLGHLTMLSVWWMRLGIRHELTDPGCPQQNGQHERMHLDLKRETTRPPAANELAQQERFDRFIEIYNFERPHEGIGMKTPSTLFAPALDRPYRGLPTDLEYPLSDVTRRVSSSGHVRLTDNIRIFVSEALRGERVGLREVDVGIWAVSFMTTEIGTFSEATRKMHPSEKK